MLSTLDRAPSVLRHATLALAISISLTISVTCAAGDLAGCYELKLSHWSPAISLGADEAFISPPSRVELTTTPEHTWDAHGFKVTAAAGASPSVHTFSYWTSDGHHVHIKWTNGHSGLTMDLDVRGSDLVGTAQTFWDFSRPEQTSHVVATRISCESKR